SLLGKYGRIIPDGEVKEAFEAYRADPEYRYYIIGSNSHPNAFIGLHRDYKLDPSTHWREVEISPAKMKQLVEGMKDIAITLWLTQNGFELLDNENRRIGVWYSIPQARTFLRMNDHGTVLIVTPGNDLYEKTKGLPFM
ncbi:MAG: hypothetical protein PHU03_06760, partial [Syntrophales bacterium]|nr:hypothetical protein [Syntrophales bacterium]